MVIEIIIWSSIIYLLSIYLCSLIKEDERILEVFYKTEDITNYIPIINSVNVIIIEILVIHFIVTGFDDDSNIDGSC